MESEGWKSKTRKEWWAKSWTEQVLSFQPPLVSRGASVRSAETTALLRKWGDRSCMRLTLSGSFCTFWGSIIRQIYSQFHPISSPTNSACHSLSQGCGAWWSPDNIALPRRPNLGDRVAWSAPVYGMKCLITTYRTQMPNAHTFCGWPGLWVFGDDQIIGSTSRAHEHSFAQSWFSRNVECMEKTYNKAETLKEYRELETLKIISGQVLSQVVCEWESPHRWRHMRTWRFHPGHTPSLAQLNCIQGLSGPVWIYVPGDPLTQSPAGIINLWTLNSVLAWC